MILLMLFPVISRSTFLRMILLPLVTLIRITPRAKRVHLMLKDIMNILMTLICIIPSM
ncbi:hypothetical protein KR49_13990 [Synechococcus sp. KORDI-49]|nr:hypothetical protein KR49_13990 [Synechococcus sp. KORDI-49]